ncbi:MAG TPA: serine/threonine-protein kinase [Myxococcota bacterium]|jgi:serine/threonine-protein kinase|nr:serine/threonine-protein kinase [Myxococcota bacterium]
MEPLVAPSPPPASAALRFGRYELLTRLAVGGMAEVFLARLIAAEGAEKPLVIKRVLPNLARNREFIERFIEEARIALPLTHDAITAVFDFGRVDDDYFIAMEYVDGPDLGTLLGRLRARGGKMPIDVALHIGATIAAGLHYAHRAALPDGTRGGIVHRDVSPQNILLAFTGAVKLTDFGIARARSRLEITSQLVRGKPCYLSPEQARGEATDARSDLFALGVVLHEMLTGVRIFEDKTPLATLERVLAAPIPAPSSLRADVDPEIDAAVLKVLARDPAGRHPDGQKLQGELTRALHRLAPGFTADRVAALLAEVFPEQAVARTAAGDSGGTPVSGTERTVPLRDRLVSRLAHAAVAVNPEKMTTAELLRLDTVAVPVLARAPTTAPVEAPPPRGPMRSATLRPAAPARTGGRRVAVLAAAALVLLGSGAALAVWLGASGVRGGASALVTTAETGPGAPVAAGSSAPRGGAATTAAAAAMAAGSATAGAPATSPATASAAAGTGRPSVEPGTVHLSAYPWAFVRIDRGARLPRHTPVRGLKLAAGAHRIEFVNPVLGLWYERLVVIEPGSIQTVSVDLEVEGRPLAGRPEGDGR